jgi:hypothetical protein
VYLICGRADRSTLYHLALSHRLFCKMALSHLYASLNTYPEPLDPSNPLLAPPWQMRAWTSLWKSIALSAINPNATIINYAVRLRVLDLHNLACLLRRFNIINSYADRWNKEKEKENIEKRLFSDGLETYCKISSSSYDGGFRQIDVKWIVDSLADVITEKATKVTKFVYGEAYGSPHSSPEHWRRWLSNFTALGSLEIIGTTALAYTGVEAALRSCKNLKSLSINAPCKSFQADEVDGCLRDILSAISGEGLETFVLKGCQLYSKTFAALNTFHANSLRKLELLATTSFYLQPLLQSSITNLQAFTLFLPNLSWYDEPLEDDKLKDIANFLRQNKALEVLDVKAGNVDLLIPLFLDDLRLKSLTVTERYSYMILTSTPFWQAISSQADSLRSLTIANEGCINGLSRVIELDFSEIPEEVRNCICNFAELKTLNLSALGFRMSGDNLAYLLANSLCNLEQITLGTLCRTLGNPSIRELRKIERPLRLRRLRLMYNLHLYLELIQ